jgi:hypothetical protein
MNCKYCGAEISKRSKTLLCRSCARKAWSKQRIKIGTVWKRPSDNYYVIKIGKGSGRDGIVEYHRWLMEQKIGRKLKRSEDVHHIDFDKSNNDINNLKLVSHSEHMRLHQQHDSNFNKNEREYIPWNKGKHGYKCKKRGPMSEEQKQKIREGVIKARRDKFWSTSKR